MASRLGKLNRKGSKKSQDVGVAILNGKPALQVNWGGRIYGAPLTLVGSSNIKEALNSDNDAWQRIALINGWNTWDLGVEISDVKEAREKIEIISAIERLEKVTKKEATEIVKDEEKLKQFKAKAELFELNKADQVNRLMDLGLSTKEINKLKYEEDRVNKIIELTKK